MYFIDKLTSKKLDNKAIWRIKTRNVLKTSQSDICRVTSLGRPQYGIPDITEPKQVKNLIRPILVLIWSETTRPK